MTKQDKINSWTFTKDHIERAMCGVKETNGQAYNKLKEARQILLDDIKGLQDIDDFAHLKPISRPLKPIDFLDEDELEYINRPVRAM